MNAKPNTEVDHLRWIVEKQPSCLMRVAADGLVLAANDAALALLGAEKPAQVLGRTITTLIAASHQDAWRGFVDKVTHGSPQSFECDLHDVTGAPRSIVLHGVPLVEHADGITSMLLSARDTAAIRRVEEALLESERLRQQLAVQASQPASDPAETQELRATIQQLENDRDQLERAVAELPRLQKLLQQGKVILKDLQTRVAQAEGERDTLAQKLAERDNANHDLWAEQEQVHKSLTDAHQRDLAELRSRLEATSGEHGDLARQLETTREELARLTSERASFEERLTEYRSQIDTLEGRVEQLLRERDEHAAEATRLLREREEQAGEISRLTQERDERSAELSRVAHERDERTNEVSRLARERDEQAGEVTRLVREHAELTDRHRHDVTRLETSLAEHAHTIAQAEERRLAEAAHAKHTIESITAELHKTADERTRLSEQLAALTHAEQNFIAERETLQRTIAEEQSTVALVRQELERTLADHARVTAELTASEASRAQLSQDADAARERLQTERERLEKEVRTALAQLNEADKVLSDHRLEVQSMDTAIRQIEPFAAAGRLAVDLARELLATITDIDARSACLVVEHPADSSAREQIEQLRSDAVRAGTLARQIIHAGRINRTEEEQSHADSN